jgi:hypothetical protein
MTDIKMQPHACQQLKQQSRIADVAMLASRAAVIATLLACAQSSTGSGSANNNSAPAKLSATSAQAASSSDQTKERIATFLAWHMQARNSP